MEQQEAHADNHKGSHILSKNKTLLALTAQSMTILIAIKV